MSAQAQSAKPAPRVAYVVKVYPRFSQTFVVNELLAHQAAGEPVQVFSLRRPNDGRFHPSITRVTTPVSYIDSTVTDAASLWACLHRGARRLPGLWEVVAEAADEPVGVVEQAVALALQVRDQGIEHLHAHFGNVATAVTRLAARLAGINYSFTAHARDIFHDAVRPEQLRRKLRDAAAVVTVSDYNVAYLRQHFGTAAATVRRIYNGLDLVAFPYRAPAARAPLILAVGRLIEKKGFADLVDACAVLAAAGETFRCEIIGAGPEVDALQARIDAHRLGDRVALTGPAPSDEVIARLQQASVLAAPCVEAGDGDRDGLPTVLLEAMALGTPCVSTPVTGIPEAIEDGVTGLLVGQRDAAALAAACARLLHDGALRQQLAGAARRRIEQRFDVARNSGELRELFAACARRGGLASERAVS